MKALATAAFILWVFLLLARKMLPRHSEVNRAAGWEV